AGRAPAAEVGLPRDDRDRPAVVDDRDRLLADGVRAEPARLARALRPHLGERALELGALTLGRERPDDVVVVHGRTGRRATLRDGDEVAVRRGEPQHEVGEREVGDHLPVPHEQVQPLVVRRAEVGVAGDEITHGRHGPQRRGVGPVESPSAPARGRPNRRPNRRPTRRPAPWGSARARGGPVHLSVELRYPAPVPAVGAMLADEEFVRWRAAWSGGSGAHVEQVDVTGGPVEGFTVTVRRTLPTDQIPAHVRSFVGGQLEIRQAEAYEPERDGERAGTVSLEITGAPVRLTGTVTLSPEGDGTVQRYDGDVKASVPLFGSAIEQAAAEAVRTALAAEESAGREWLAR